MIQLAAVNGPADKHSENICLCPGRSGLIPGDFINRAHARGGSDGGAFGAAVAFFDFIYETFGPQQMLLLQIRAVICRPIAKVPAQQVRIIGGDDVRIQAVFGVQQTLDFQEKREDLRILAPDVSAAEPSVPVLPGNGAAKGIDKIKHRIADGFHLPDIVRVLQVQKGPGMQQALGNVPVNYKRDPAMVQYGIDSPEILDQFVGRNRGVFNQGQDFFFAFQFIENRDCSLSNGPEIFPFPGR